MNTPFPHGPALAGIWPAMVTPLNADLSINIARFARHAQDLLEKGCAGVTPFGTTGEGPSFSVAERCAALEGLVAAGVPAARIIVSTSCAALPDALALTRHAVRLGVRAVLLMPPFFLKDVPDQGVIDACGWLLDRVAEDADAAARLRVVLYHIPQVSGVRVSLPVIEALRKRWPGTIIGLKDSSGERAGSVQYGQALMPGMQVWVGNEPDLATMGQLGSRGAISGVANILPRLIARLAVARGESDPAAQADIARLQDFMRILHGHSLTPRFKAMLAHLSGDDGWRRVRPPLVAVPEAHMPDIAAQMRAFAPGSDE